MTNNVSAYLKYANLQMAAESLFGITPSSTPGLTTSVASMDLVSLTRGNNRSSRFTTVSANQFLDDGWQVVEHKSNTGTGFSGTLFKNTNTNEFVLSFRSTEFIDDAARDNQASNALEVAKGGWAMGQIADMEDWFKTLNQSGGPLSGKSFTVTGYSLGGHLATAFNLLHQGEGRINATYTFNGAGVGTVNTGESLRAIVDRFDLQRNNVSGHEIVFTDPQATIFYNQIHAKLTGGVAPTAEDIQNATLLVGNLVEGKLLKSALERVRDIVNENIRVGNLPSGSPTSPAPAVPPSTAIDGTKLDYQLAVLLAQRSTRAVGIANGAINTAGDWRNTVTPSIPGFYDVYGATYPSAVSNSQLHYGAATGVFIENQPLYRGSVAFDVLKASWEASDLKLLVPGFSLNDFGDTHSLVLLVDSLNIQNALSTLDSQVSQFAIDTILRESSNAKAVEMPGSQGQAEGDVLETY